MRPGCEPILQTLLEEYDAHKDMGLFFERFSGAFDCGLDHKNCSFAAKCRSLIRSHYDGEHETTPPFGRANDRSKSGV